MSAHLEALEANSLVPASRIAWTFYLRSQQSNKHEKREAQVGNTGLGEDQSEELVLGHRNATNSTRFPNGNEFQEKKWMGKVAGN